MKNIVSMHATYKNMAFEELERWASMDFDGVSRELAGGGITEHAILKTCNRIEIYAVVQSPSSFKSAIENLSKNVDSHNVHYLSGKDSVRHLMRVCSGMESMVIGEQEIQRQVKEALAEAQNAGRSGKILNYLFMKVLSTGKDVRSSTSIAKGVSSIPQAASRMITGAGSIKSVCIVGTGNMAKSMLGYLKDSGKEITVCGRDAAKAKGLASMFSVKHITLNGLDVGIYDSIVTAVKSQKPILNIGDGTRPSLIIDLGTPRNVATSGRNHRYVSMKELESNINGNITIRRNEAKKAEAIIDKHLASAMERLEAMGALEPIKLAVV